jgi:AraC-like DNA-binding protein
VSDSAELISAFLHGLASGAMMVIAFALWRSSLSPHLKIAGGLAGASLIAMFVTESSPLWQAMGSPRLLLAIAYPAAGAFWLLVLSVFDDWRVTPWTLAPAAVLLVSGFAMGATLPPLSDWIWAARNAVSGLLALHAGFVVVRGWSGDLLEARRRFRALLLGLGCLFALFEVAAGFAYRLDRDERWLTVTAGHPYGGLILAALCAALATLMLQPRLGVFGTSRRSEPAPDPRAETAERLLLDRLEGFMATGAWRREGMTIGDLARDLETPEHRLRRLINQRLGHRNFAEFVNSHRIAAAKRRLEEPAEARVTVAAIAFDLGYGSLGPFNRAFRAATGASPTEWRRRALAAGSPEMKEAG